MSELPSLGSSASVALAASNELQGVRDLASREVVASRAGLSLPCLELR
jgi:hypothetical protein